MILSKTNTLKITHNSKKTKKMKKTLTLLFAVFIALSSYSQDWESGDINKKSYVRFGLATPTYKYYGFKGKSDFENTFNIKNRIGGIFEVGTIFPINSLNIADHMRIGINADWVSIKGHIFNLEDSEVLYNYFAQSKVGLAFTYAPARAVSIDVYGKVIPVWAAGTYYSHDDDDSDKDHYRGYMQVMYSTGVNVKFAFIMVGFEYEFGSLKLKNADGDYLGNSNDANSKKTPMPGFNLTFGFSF